MYRTIFVDKRIELTPKELSDARTSEHIRDILMTKLKEQEEGKCNAEGYIRPGSIQMLRRSMGSAESGKFTGNWIYDCKIRCEILKPVAYDHKDPDNSTAIMSFKVIDKNKAGVIAVFEEAIRVLMPQDTHAGIPEFESLKINDVVRVRMIRHTFQTNDPYILAVGDLVIDGVSSKAPIEEEEEEVEDDEGTTA
jgi:DNA-directed RNA polymerase subunit E'/Rpb7